MTFHGCVTCHSAPSCQCKMHKSGMSRKNGDAFHSTGTGLREQKPASPEPIFCVFLFVSIFACFAFQVASDAWHREK